MDARRELQSQDVVHENEVRQGMLPSGGRYTRIQLRGYLPSRADEPISTQIDPGV